MYITKIKSLCRENIPTVNPEHSNPEHSTTGTQYYMGETKGEAILSYLLIKSHPYILKVKISLDIYGSVCDGLCGVFLASG